MCVFFFSGVGELSWSGPGRGLSRVGFFSQAEQGLAWKLTMLVLLLLLLLERSSRKNHKHCVLVAK